MIKRQHLLLPFVSLLVAGLISCSQSGDLSSSNASNTSASIVAQTITPSPVRVTPSSTPSTPASSDLTQMFSRIWRVTAPSGSAPNSLYIFLPNGTLMQTSCVETYAIFPWTIDKAAPKVLNVSENGRPAYTAEILELTDTTLRLKQKLILSNETQEVTLTAVEEEFVCPDLPK
ncbi:MAG: hypothetical protein KME15_03395 [Drouetiella hepatica Uher 2000/2452]|jgi:hypothetical protein|uniref:Lipoprotein n=1 Tax=Drouetiella hepatica Uher 2000/2452 TaxID=904376 RepID=A0A951QAB6_9CYAN|nr:hypothetical protein [Drouetiella hepatica Uher 2000/2452]